MVKQKTTTLLREMPVIRRAREFHLYDNEGRRFLDLYLNQGRAILGHRPEGFSLILKNTLARGVYAEYPSHEEGKMLKAARTLWGDAFPVIRYYRSWERPGDFLRQEAGLTGPEGMADPALGEEGPVSLWRPWLAPSKGARFILPVLPVPGMETGWFLCAAQGTEGLPEGDLPSPVSAAGINRCLWSLRARLDQTPASPPDAREDLPPFEGWIRRGPYLQWQGPGDDYPALFRSALAAGILLPPDPGSPAVIPSQLTSGDLKALHHFFGKGA